MQGETIEQNLQHVYIRPRSSVKPRLDIVELKKNDVQFALFIQAYNKMIAEDPKYGTSFFQIGGIHGLPFEKYPGEPDGNSGSGWQGYCHHGLPTFPTWHRAYLLYIENSLIYYAGKVVEDYKSGPLYNKMTEELDNLRFPYLHWDIYNFEMPVFLLTRNISILGVDGNPTYVTNPLFGYQLQKTIQPSGAGFPFLTVAGTWTIRWGAPGYPLSYSNYTDGMFDFMNEYNAKCIYPGLFQMYLNPDYESFSNHFGVVVDGEATNDLKDSNGNIYGWLASLELYHDCMHDAFGGNIGQMANTPVAGFDPIFFLHHCNVDRIFAIWQAANWNGKRSWFDNTDKDETAGSGTFTIPPGTQIKSTTELTPFRTADLKYVNSDQIHYWENWGYTYPEVQDHGYQQHPFLFKFNLLKSFHRLQQDVIVWTVYITGVPKSYNDGSYQVQVYLTNPTSTQPSKPYQKRQYVGTIPVFSKGPTCENCQVTDSVSAQFILNPTMLANGITIYPEPGTQGPKPDYTGQVQYLTNSIHLVYTDKGGNPLPIDPPSTPPTVKVDYKDYAKVAYALGDETQRKKIIDLSAKIHDQNKRNISMVNIVEKLNVDPELAIAHFVDQIHKKREE